MGRLSKPSRVLGKKNTYPDAIRFGRADEVSHDFLHKVSTILSLYLSFSIIIDISQNIGSNSLFLVIHIAIESLVFGRSFPVDRLGRVAWGIGSNIAHLRSESGKNALELSKVFAGNQVSGIETVFGFHGMESEVRST